LPRCEIDLDACPLFARLLKTLRKKYRKIDADLAEVFEEVEKDYETAAGADPIPGWQRTVWKHRCGSSDMKVGRSRGFRIISVIKTDADPHILYPVLIYAKVEKTDVTTVEIAEAVKSLERELEELKRGLEPELDATAESET
jgi:hypothetical protein